MVVAGLREEGTNCRRCQHEIRQGDQTTCCPRCGGIHHWNCWNSTGTCAAYECASHHTSGAKSAAVMRVSDQELSKAVPLPSSRPHVPGWVAAVANPNQNLPKRWSRTAVASIIVAIAGIPLFGLVTGIVAAVLGCIALAGHSNRWKGSMLAVAGIVLGILDVTGWSIGLWFVWQGPMISLSANAEFEPDPKALEQLPPTINRAMKSNVLIETAGDLTHLRGGGLGSGVVVRIKDQLAWIVTNRHVIDPTFADTGGVGSSSGLPTGTRLMVKSLGQPLTPGRLVWVAPHGIDLALVTMSVSSPELCAAVWEKDPKTTVGNGVFAIGNPHGLGWTYTPGGISQMRLQTKGPLEIRVIQTSAAINSGNSGGGLYDSDGRLVGINTWTQDKRYAEGLSFSIAFHTLLPLLPEEYHLPDHQLENDTNE